MPNDVTMTSLLTSLSTSDENANPNVAVSYVQGTFCEELHVPIFFYREEISAQVNCTDQKTFKDPIFGRKIKIFIILELAKVMKITVWSAYMKELDGTDLQSNFHISPNIFRDFIAILEVKKRVFSKNAQWRHYDVIFDVFIDVR